MPSFPAFVARNKDGVSQVVMAYFGLQFRGAPPARAKAALDDLDAAFGAANGPGHHDRATHTDGAGHTEIVSIAYWDDPAVFDRWFDVNREGWIGDGCRGGGVGRWIEAIRPRAEEFETLFSVPERAEGIAALSKGWSDEIQEHAYWGGMRDRIPLSQTDALLGGSAPLVSRDGSRVRVMPRQGLCLIRSGQDWSATEGDDRAMYLDGVEPDLRVGMEFLRDEGARSAATRTATCTWSRGASRSTAASV